MADLPQSVAVCAPGARDVAAIVITVKGEAVSEIREHPWLAGYGGVLLFSAPDESRWENALRAHLGITGPHEPPVA